MARHLSSAPGGGFHALSINSEGNWVANWCLKNGIVAFVLKYRLVPALGDAIAAAKAVLANYGASDSALLDIIFGKAKPEGKLPFELPSSMEAVPTQRPDAPYDDSVYPLYPYGFEVEL